MSSTEKESGSKANNGPEEICVGHYAIHLLLHRNYGYFVHCLNLPVRTAMPKVKSRIVHGA